MSVILSCKVHIRNAFCIHTVELDKEVGEVLEAEATVVDLDQEVVVEGGNANAENERGECGCEKMRMKRHIDMRFRPESIHTNFVISLDEDSRWEAVQRTSIPSIACNST